MPLATKPLVNAVSNMYPEMRVSFPMITRLWLAPDDLSTREMACPVFMAISGVMGYSFAFPRIPSVPKSLVAIGKFHHFSPKTQVK